MGLLHGLNVALERSLKLKVVSAPRPAVSVPAPAPVPPPAIPIRKPAFPEVDRLLRRPVFVISSVRSGSTLLRVVLNSHSQLHAPHEMHVRRLAVELTTPPVIQAMEALDLNQRDLEHMLWDRVLHRELLRSGKQWLVDKTPSNVFALKRIRTVWPDARFIYLLRHPQSIVQSWHEGDPDARPMPEAIHRTLQYMEHLEAGRHVHPGLTVRYEDLTSDPQEQTRRICEFLEVPWEPAMAEYGQQNHGEFVKGIGDWSDKIKSGSIQQGRPLPADDEIAPELRAMCAAWDYLQTSKVATVAG